MATRTTETTVTFEHAFTLSALGGPQPAGTYRVVVDEEEVEGLSFLAYHRVATMFHTPAMSRPGGPDQVVLVDPAELATLLKADHRA